MIKNIVRMIANKAPSNKSPIDKNVYNVDKELLHKVLTYDYDKDINELGNYYKDKPRATPTNVMILLLEHLSAINDYNYPFTIEFMEQERQAFNKAMERVNINFSTNDYVSFLDNEILNQHLITWHYCQGEQAK